MSTNLKWNASHMPGICVEIAAFLQDPTMGSSDLAETSSRGLVAARSKQAENVLSAPMFWFAAALTPLVQHIADRGVPELLRDLLPTPSGVLLWGAAPMTVGWNEADGEIHGSLDGVAWETIGDEVGIGLLSRVSAEDAATMASECLEGGQIGTAHRWLERPPMGVGYVVVPLNAQPDDHASFMDRKRWYPRMVNLFMSTMVVIKSEQIADVTEVVASRSQAKRAARSGVRRAPVRVVNMKPMPGSGRGSDGPRQACDYAYMVAGHWRNQRCGAKRSQVRRVWIESFRKGPEGQVPRAAKPVVHLVNR